MISQGESQGGIKKEYKKNVTHLGLLSPPPHAPCQTMARSMRRRRKKAPLSGEIMNLNSNYDSK